MHKLQGFRNPTKRDAIHLTETSIRTSYQENVKILFEECLDERNLKRHAVRQKSPAGMSIKKLT
jgi:hypothetical protein